MSICLLFPSDSPLLPHCFSICLLFPAERGYIYGLFSVDVSQDLPHLHKASAPSVPFCQANDFLHAACLRIDGLSLSTQKTWLTENGCIHKAKQNFSQRFSVGESKSKVLWYLNLMSMANDGWDVL